MTRLPWPERDALSPEARRVWDEIAGPRGGMRGPYAMLMYVPDLAERVAQLGARLRFGSRLGGADRELAILAAGRELGSRFEWVMHEPIARREGTRPEAIQVVAAAGPLDTLTARERTIVEVVRSLCRTHALPDDLYGRAEAELGREALVELITLAGFYGMIAFILLGFDVSLPDGMEAPF